jgi:hypothetical protein
LHAKVIAWVLVAASSHYYFNQGEILFLRWLWWNFVPFSFPFSKEVVYCILLWFVRAPHPSYFILLSFDMLICCWTFIIFPPIIGTSLGIFYWKANSYIYESVSVSCAVFLLCNYNMYNLFFNINKKKVKNRHGRIFIKKQEIRSHKAHVFNEHYFFFQK